ncbi:MAG: carboxypeptidase regulatory-like domain-containing protein, partial [Candidatus Aminicenantaceae bacterium]
MKTKFVVMVTAMLLVLSPMALSQSRATGAISGTIYDDTGEPLPGVSVVLTSPSLQGERTAVTGVDGAYRFPAIPPGVYSVRAELQGFGTVVQENVRVTTTVRLTVDLTLEPAAVTEEVTVIATSPTVDVKSTETASVTLSKDLISNVPFSNFTTDIVNLAPGVSGNVAFGSSQSTGVSYQMDGVDVSDPEAGSAWVFADPNIVEEAKVMGIGLPAEYGNFTGVIFNVITKSGGNEFSGMLQSIYQGKKDASPKGFWQADNNQ